MLVLLEVVHHDDALVLAVAEKYSMLQMKQDNKMLQDNMQVPQVQEEARNCRYSCSNKGGTYETRISRDSQKKSGFQMNEN